MYIKIIFTCAEGAPIINILNILGYESNDVISLCSMWSLGYMPEFKNELYKGCDIFFSWGDLHDDSYLKCKSPFNSIVQTGYIGDYAINHMKKNHVDITQKLQTKDLKIIAVYDNVAFNDYLITYKQLHNFYKGVLSLLKEGSFACIIKTKRKGSLYKDIDNNLLNEILGYKDRVMITDEKADLSPAFQSDLVYAFHQNSLGSVASVWGVKTVIYDESSFIDKKNISKNTRVINSYDELIPTIRLLDQFTSGIDRDSSIDPFVDGNAQLRISEYIQTLLNSQEKSKSIMIKKVNQIYKKSYGADKVLENDKN